MVLDSSDTVATGRPASSNLKTLEREPLGGRPFHARHFSTDEMSPVLSFTADVNRERAQ